MAGGALRPHALPALRDERAHGQPHASGGSRRSGLKGPTPFFTWTLGAFTVQRELRGEQLLRLPRRRGYIYSAKGGCRSGNGKLGAFAELHTGTTTTQRMHGSSMHSFSRCLLSKGALSLDVIRFILMCAMESRHWLALFLFMITIHSS